MKSVEVYVREAAKLPESLLGTKLARTAFDPTNGPLADLTAEAGERDARSALFAGAIGSYKNPHSHRDVDLSDPQEAIEIMMLGSQGRESCSRAAASCRTPAPSFPNTGRENGRSEPSSEGPLRVQ